MDIFVTINITGNDINVVRILYDFVIENSNLINSRNIIKQEMYYLYISSNFIVVKVLKNYKF